MLGRSRWSGWLLVLAACPETGGGQTGGQSGAEVIGDPSTTPTTAPAECATDAECREQALEWIEPLRAPAAAPVLTGASCGASLSVGSVTGSFCQCSFGVTQAFIGPPQGRFETEPRCFTRGRAGDCLWQSTEFQGCNDSGAGCEPVCRELSARLAADAARSFDPELLGASCSAGSCSNVTRVNGECFSAPNFHFDPLSCSGEPGVETAPPVVPATYDDVTINHPTPGTVGQVILGVNDTYWGGSHTWRDFSVRANFFRNVGSGYDYGSVIDPLEGVDDCGVARGTGAGAAFGFTEYTDVAEASVVDGAASYALTAPSWDPATYQLNLSESGVEPRHSGSYGFRASGGGLGRSITLDGIVLPEPLVISPLDREAQLPRGDLALSWTGRGDAPLEISLRIYELLAATLEPYTIVCLAEDDGAFTIPGALLEPAPDGQVTALFVRANRRIQSSGGADLESIGELRVRHEFALGPRCDRSAVLDACEAYVRAAEAQQGAIPPEQLPEWCPAYLATACGACPEYFECQTRALTGASSVCSCL